MGITSVNPSHGPTTGGQYVKIQGIGFTIMPVNNIVVKFGDKTAREVFWYVSTFCLTSISMKRNMIICETPEHNAGTVKVSVSFDKTNYLPNDLQYTYVSMSDKEGLEDMITAMYGQNISNSSTMMNNNDDDVDEDDE